MAAGAEGRTAAAWQAPPGDERGVSESPQALMGLVDWAGTRPAPGRSRGADWFVVVVGVANTALSAWALASGTASSSGMDPYTRLLALCVGLMLASLGASGLLAQRGNGALSGWFSVLQDILSQPGSLRTLRGMRQSASGSASTSIQCPVFVWLISVMTPFMVPPPAWTLVRSTVSSTVFEVLSAGPSSDKLPLVAHPVSRSAATTGTASLSDNALLATAALS